MPEIERPGVYIQEVSSGPTPILGASTSVTAHGISQILGRLVPTRRRQRGALGRLRRALSASPPPEQVAGRLTDALDTVEARINHLRSALPVLDDTLVHEVLAGLGQRALGPRRELHRRLDRREGDDDGRGLLQLLESWMEEVEAAARDLSPLCKLVDEQAERDSGRYLQLSFDLGTAHRRLADVGDRIGSAVNSDPNRVRWIELKRGRGGRTRARIASAPL